MTVMLGVKAGSKGKEPFRRPLHVTCGPFRLSSLSEMLYVNVTSRVGRSLSVVDTDRQLNVLPSHVG